MYNGGLFFQYRLKPFLSFKTSISYFRKVLDEKTIYYTVPANEPEFIEIIKIQNIINIPFLIRFNFFKDKFYVNTGPELDILINSKTKFGQQPFSELVKRKNNPLFPNWATGIGINIPISDRYSLSFEVRDAIGLTGIFNNNNWPKHHYNTVLFLYDLTYQFDKKKVKNKIK